MITPAATAARARSVATGNPYYFTGDPCENGHNSPRRVDTDACVICARSAEISREHGDRPVVVRNGFYELEDA